MVNEFWWLVNSVTRNLYPFVEDTSSAYILISQPLNIPISLYPYILISLYPNILVS
jgi:hypothetical protein